MLILMAWALCWKNKRRGNWEDIVLEQEMENVSNERRVAEVDDGPPPPYEEVEISAANRFGSGIGSGSVESSTK